MPVEESAQDEIRRFEEQFRNQPESLVFARLADAYRKSGDSVRALEILEEGILRHPDYLSAHIVRARTFRDLGQVEEAQAAFERVIDIDAQNLVAIRGLAEIARDSGDRESEIAWLERLDAADPQGDESAARLAELREQPASTQPAPPEPDGGEWWNDPPPEALELEPRDSEPHAPSETAPAPAEDQDSTGGQEEEETAELGSELWSGPAVVAGEGGVRDAFTEDLNAAILDDELPAAAEESLAEEPSPADAWWYEPREATEDVADQDAEKADDGEDEDADLLTRTMADLYARQGLIEEAEAIYRELLIDRPDDQALRDGLDAVLGMRAARGAGAAASIVESDLEARDELEVEGEQEDAVDEVPVGASVETIDPEPPAEVAEAGDTVDGDEPGGQQEGEIPEETPARGPLVAEQLIRVLREGDEVADRLPEKPLERSVLEQWLESLRG
jgi:tetratricopeptide (TPR) repeat protein